MWPENVTENNQVKIQILQYKKLSNREPNNKSQQKK